MARAATQWGFGLATTFPAPLVRGPEASSSICVTARSKSEGLRSPPPGASSWIQALLDGRAVGPGAALGPQPESLEQEAACSLLWGVGGRVLLGDVELGGETRIQAAEVPAPNCASTASPSVLKGSRTVESRFPSGIHIHYFMQEPHRILPSAIPTPPGSLGPHVALPKSPPILAHTWRLVPQETCQVGDPMFFSCSKSLIPAGVGTLASRSQRGPTLQAALATPGLGQARRDASESSLATSFSFAFYSVHAGFRC